MKTIKGVLTDYTSGEWHKKCKGDRVMKTGCDRKVIVRSDAEYLSIFPLSRLKVMLLSPYNSLERIKALKGAIKAIEKRL